MISIKELKGYLTLCEANGTRALFESSELSELIERLEDADKMAEFYSSFEFNEVTLATMRDFGASANERADKYKEKWGDK